MASWVRRELTRLACHEKGVDYELVPTRPGEVPLNPFGKIPLMKHGGFALYESPVIVRVVDRIEKHLGSSRFLAGESITAADLFLVPIFFYFPEIEELKALGDASPHCMRWAREMGARPSVKATDPQFRGLNR